MCCTDGLATFPPPLDVLFCSTVDLVMLKIVLCLLLYFSFHPVDSLIHWFLSGIVGGELALEIPEDLQRWTLEA